MSNVTQKKKVFVGLSGGVDSAVSAALLQKDGYEVAGVFIRISIEGYPCTAGEDKLSAQRVAAHLNIPFIEIDLSQEYKKEVFASTIAEFAKGRTPNPDTLCNQKIKFGTFFNYCIERGAAYVATGHYAQVIDGALYKGADESKDQSYFLWMVPQAALAKTLFPIGGLQKTEVRELAKKFGLPNAARKDSQGLCFLGPITIADMLTKELQPAAGEVLSEQGEVVGTHRGAALYTLGQRHGFEIAHRDANSVPQYVIAKDTALNTLTVSESKYPAHAARTKVMLTDTNWLGPAESGEYTAQYRYHSRLISATLDTKNNSAVLNEPHYIPAGQSLVLYDGERCIGGGIVDSATLP